MSLHIVWCTDPTYAIAIYGGETRAAAELIADATQHWGRPDAFRRSSLGIERVREIVRENGKKGGRPPKKGQTK